MATIQEVGQAFNARPQRADRHDFGTVSAVSSDTCTVSVAGEDMTAARCCSCRAGDRVLVLIMVNGRAAAISVVGGETVGQWSAAQYIAGSDASGGIYYRYNRDLRMVTVCIYYLSVSSTSQQDIGTIPEGLRPLGAVGGAMSPNGYSDGGTFGIRTDGSVWIKAQASGRRWYGEATYGY